MMTYLSLTIDEDKQCGEGRSELSYLSVKRGYLVSQSDLIVLTIDQHHLEVCLWIQISGEGGRDDRGFYYYGKSLAPPFEQYLVIAVQGYLNIGRLI
jgi:hypothetical protein